MAKSHVVSRTYLKGFAQTQGSPKGLVVYNLRSPLRPQIIAQAIVDVKRVSTIDNFYIIQREMGPDNSIEDGLCEIETNWPFVRAALKRGTLTDGEWGVLLLSAAAQEGRSPRNRFMFATSLEDQLATIEREGKAQGFSDALIADWRDGCIQRHQGYRRGGDAIQDPHNLALLPLPAFMRQNLEFFASMKKMLLTSVVGDFVTSDHPVIWFDPERQEQNPCPNKLSLSAEVTFPLDRRHCVVFSYMPLATTAVASENTLRIINARTIKYSLEQVYAFPALGTADRERH
jgi:hypothetical protein